MAPSDAWSLPRAGPETYQAMQVPSIFEPLARMLLSRVALRPGQAVLDIACGTGVVTRLAAEAVGPDGTVVGVDFNQPMLDVAAGIDGGDVIEWRQGDAGALPVTDDSFDVVLCQQGLQYFPDKVAALREMRRALKPGGMAWLAVWQSPEHRPTNRAWNRVLARHLGPDVTRVSEAPFSLGDGAELRRLMTEGGFQDVVVEAAVFTHHMKPPEISIPGQLASLPFGPKIAALDTATRDAIVAEIAAELADYRTPEGLTVPQGTHFVSGRA